MTKKKNTPSPKKTKTARYLPFGLGIGIVVATAVIYWFVGRPDLMDTPTLTNDMDGKSGASADQQDMPSVGDMIDKLKARLEENPDDVQGWMLLGQSLLYTERYPESITAYKKAAELEPKAPQIHSAIGEAITLEANGTVTEDAAKSFRTALDLDPSDQPSRFYMGDYAFQHGEFQTAYDTWLGLFKEVPADTPWLGLLDQRIRQVAGNLGIEVPKALEEKKAEADKQKADQAAAGQMSPEEQQAMIEQMVAGLASRLQEDPSDLDGWMKLGRAYMVMGRPEDAADAYKHVVDAKPDDSTSFGLYVQARLSAASEKGGPIPEELVADLRKLSSLDPENTTALYFLGVASVEAGDNAAAKDYWQKLLKILPPNSEDARFVQNKIDGLGQ